MESVLWHRWVSAWVGVTIKASANQFSPPGSQSTWRLCGALRSEHDIHKAQQPVLRTWQFGPGTCQATGDYGAGSENSGHVTKSWL